MSNWTFRFFSPVFLLALLLLDNQLTEMMRSFNIGGFQPVSHLFLIALMYTTLKHQWSYLFIMTLAFGIIYDSYYNGVLGIAAALFPLTALFVYEIGETVFVNRWTRFVTVIIIVFFFDSASTLIAAVTQLADIDFTHFVIYQLAPSLLVNILFALLLQRPFEALYGIKKTETGYKLT